MNNRGGIKTAVVVGVMVIVLIIAVYFTFFFYYKCGDIACFKSHQEKCTKTKFSNDGKDVVWDYKIFEKKGGNCEIKVGISKIKVGSIDKLPLEGKSMVCILPFGSLASPESDINKCTGELKEEMQGLIIQKLHSYIIDNLGEIGEELNKITNAEIIISEDAINKSANIT